MMYVFVKPVKRIKRQSLEGTKLSCKLKCTKLTFRGLFPALSKVPESHFQGVKTRAFSTCGWILRDGTQDLEVPGNLLVVAQIGWRREPFSQVPVVEGGGGRGEQTTRAFIVVVMRISMSGWKSSPSGGT